jgi:hypothetical protein
VVVSVDKKPGQPREALHALQVPEMLRIPVTADRTSNVEYSGLVEVHVGAVLRNAHITTITLGAITPSNNPYALSYACPD